MGGRGPPQQVPDYSGLSIQTSAMVTCVPYAGGQVRATPNLIYYTDYTVHSSKGGKGGGKSQSYTYSASIILAVCEGPCTTVLKTWVDQGFYSGFSDPGFAFFPGTIPQSPWSYLVSAHPNDAFGYQGICYLAAENYNLGASPVVPQTSFEIEAPNYNTGYTSSGGDADCALEIQRFLTNPEYGALFPAAFLDTTSFDGGSLLSGPNAATTGDGAYQTYCRAMGWGISPFINNQEQAAGVIARWLQITNTAPVWTGYSLKFVPWGDATVSGHGVTYNPPVTSVFNFGDNDFVQDNDQDPVIAELSDWFDAANALVLEVCDRAQEYNPVPIDVLDQSQNELIGRRPGSTVMGHEICDLTMAFQVASLLEQRMVYVRETYHFKVGPEYSALEPMDCGTITDVILGVVNYPVRIREIEEDDDGSFMLTCEEFPGTLGQPLGQTTQGGIRSYNNQQVSPGIANDPIIFEPNVLAAQRLNSGSSVPILCILASGSNPNWGGAVINVSSDGGATYIDIGAIKSRANQGYLTANLSSYGGTNPDTGDTLSVDLTESNGVLASASTSTDAANGVTVGIIQDSVGSYNFELLSPETVTLTGTNAYDLTTLYRGQYGTTAAAHTTGALYGRLDDALFVFPMPAGYVGVPLKIKLQSYNTYGNQTQDITTCTAYSYTPNGSGYGGGSGGAPTTPTGLAAMGGAGITQLTWSLNPTTDNVTEYLVYRASGLSQPFSSASIIWSGLTSAYTDVLSAGGYTYFLIARNIVGLSGYTSGVNATVTSGAAGSITLVASEALSANQLVNVWDDSGAAKVQLANASSGKVAHGFVSASVSSGGTATVFFAGLISGLTGLTPGVVWLDTTPGGVVSTPPSGTGDYQQPVGVCIDGGTAMYFDPHLSVKLA